MCEGGISFKESMLLLRKSTYNRIVGFFFWTMSFLPVIYFVVMINTLGVIALEPFHLTRSRSMPPELFFIIIIFFFIDFFFLFRFLLLWLPLNYGQKNWLPPPTFFCVCIILFILGHARNYSIAWARFDQTLVQYSCCWNKRRGALSSFKMGDQSIPGQDEDIFLGTNQINVFFIDFFVSVLLDYRNKHYSCSLLFRFFLGSFVRKFLLPLGCRTFDGFIWFLAVLFSLTPYYVLACYCYFFLFLRQHCRLCDWWLWLGSSFGFLRILSGSISCYDDLFH